jgi:hypothetical protein
MPCPYMDYWNLINSRSLAKIPTAKIFDREAVPLLDLALRHPMRVKRLAIYVSALADLFAVDCSRAAPKSRMAEHEVIRATKTEMAARFPDSVAAPEPYHAEIEDGTWSVWGTVPAGVRGGGAP